MRRVVLVRHASTRAMRRAPFGDDDPLDSRGRDAAFALRDALPSAERALAAPCLPAFQTASIAGYAPVVTEPALADCDYGRWAGLALEEVAASEPDALAAWLADAEATPHGGESFAALIARVGGWLDGVAGGDGVVVAVVPGTVARAAVVHALGAPPAAFFRVDVAPAGVTELHARDGRWSVVRVNG